ncbi:MAG: alpha/beta hydrolase-fold protein [Chloroflexota bacterium]
MSKNMVLGSEVHTMDSVQTGRTYRVTVSLPLGYDAPADAGFPFNNLPESWATVYVLDGNWYADMVAGMIRPTAWCGGITDAIVVGIGYPQDDNPVEAIRTSFIRRDLDLTPIADADLEAEMTALHRYPTPKGDAGSFLAFLQQELIPFVENTYRANSEQRILAGHSYGGLFASYALFETPELFHSWIIGSPTLAYGERFVFQKEATYAQENDDLVADVYLYAGDEEIVSLGDTTLTDTLRFAALLESRQYKGLSLKKRLFMEQNHCAVVTPGFQWGLMNTLKRG